jgi:glycosyltransferase involved in cell wall biosynthesis
MITGLVSVYIPSHNYGRYLSDAISSVINQTYSEWELIVIDDGSQDQTQEIISNYAHHPKIRTVKTKGIGLTEVCNLAISMANGEFIIRLDGDDVFDENILLVLSNYLQKNADVALIFPDYYTVDEFGEITGHEYRHKIYDINHHVNVPPHGACTMVRLSILKEIGGYRTDLGAQDGFDLWTKISVKYKSINVNLPLFYYRQHGSNLTTNSQKILFARRKIKYDAVSSALIDMQPVIGIIPCRKYFDFKLDLWKNKVNDVTLLELAITACLKSKLLDHIVVACDNSDAQEIIESFEDSRLHFYLRNEKSTNPGENVSNFIHEAVRPFDENLNGITILKYIQTPFVSGETLDEAITTLIMNKVDSTNGVEVIRSEVYKRTPNGLEPLVNKLRLNSEFNNVYRDSKTFTAFKTENLKFGNIYGARIGYFEVSPLESFFVSNERDLAYAQYIDNTEVKA